MIEGRTIALSAAVQFEIWEQGAGWHPIDQALLVLRYACPDQSMEEVSEWPIGLRDRRLLEIRRDTFGDHLEGYVECPACGSGLEFELSCEALMRQGLHEGRASRTVECEGGVWELRMPNSRDLSVVVTTNDVRDAREALIARCVTNRAESTAGPGLRSDALQSTLAAELAALDPLAEILIDLTCQACGHGWHSLFDIATFLWSEIRMRSRRLLQDIDVLARTYGWPEQEILRMSDRRRGLYVEMALS